MAAVNLNILSVRLPTGDTPVCNVTLEPYIILKRDSNPVSADDVPEEGSGEGLFQLRSRWFRSSIPRGGTVCSVHQDKEATIQCTVCLRLKVAPHLSYHCTAECFKRSWSRHLDLHRQAHTNGVSENGYDMVQSGKGTGTMSTGETWVEVCRARTYTPGPEDIGYVLKYECSVVDALHPYVDLGRPSVAFSARVRPAPSLPVRALIALPLPHGSPPARSGSFTIMSYNLLADLYAKGSDVFGHCPQWAMSWHYRKRNLIGELLAHRPDIVCLQEVQSDHYADFLSPEMLKAGYAGIYKKKTAEVFTGNSYAIDGCATFFRRDRFQLVKKYEVEFNKAAVSLAEQMTNAQQKKLTMNRLLKDNVALIAVLESLDNGAGGPEAAMRGKQLLCVANTHIHANPELNDVKLWQVHTLLKGLEKIAHSADIPMLVAGDFNSSPGSAAHCLLTRGRVEPGMLDQALDPLGILRAPEQKLSHSLPLSSAYSALWDAPPVSEALRRQRTRLDSVHREPLFTHIGRDFKGTLDYMMYTRDSLLPRALLELPTEAEVLGKPESLPNANWSSDHIALMAEFQLLGGGSQR